MNISGYHNIQIQRTGNNQWNVQEFTKFDNGDSIPTSNLILKDNSLHEVKVLKKAIQNIQNPDINNQLKANDYIIVNSFFLNKNEEKSLLNKIKGFRKKTVNYFKKSKLNIASKIANRITLPMFEEYGKKDFFNLQYLGKKEDVFGIENQPSNFSFKENILSNLDALRRAPFSDPFTQIATESFQNWQKNFQFQKELISDYRIVLKGDIISLDPYSIGKPNSFILEENKETVKEYRKFLEKEYGLENIKKVEHKYGFSLENLEKNGAPLFPEHIYRMNIGLNMIENTHLEDLIQKLPKLIAFLGKSDSDLLEFFSKNSSQEFSIRELRGMAREFKTSQNLNHFIKGLSKNLGDCNSDQIQSLMNILNVPDEQHDHIYTGRKIQDQIILGYYNGKTTQETSFMPWLDDQELLQTAHPYKSKLPTSLEIKFKQTKEYIEAFEQANDSFTHDYQRISEIDKELKLEYNKIDEYRKNNNIHFSIKIKNELDLLKKQEKALKHLGSRNEIDYESKNLYSSEKNLDALIQLNEKYKHILNEKVETFNKREKLFQDKATCEKFSIAMINSVQKLEEKSQELQKILKDCGIIYKEINEKTLIADDRDFSLDAAHVFMKKHLASPDIDGTWKVGGIIPGPKSSTGKNQFYCVTSCTDNGLGNMNFTFEPLGKDSELPVRQVFRSTASSSYNQNGAQSILADIAPFNSPGEKGFNKAAKYENPFYDKYTQPIWAAYHEQAKELFKKIDQPNAIGSLVEYYQIALQDFKKCFLDDMEISKNPEKKADYTQALEKFTIAQRELEKKEMTEKEYVGLSLSIFERLGEKYQELARFKIAKNIVIDGHSLGGGLSQQAYYNQLVNRRRLPLPNCGMLANAFDPTKGFDKEKNKAYSEFTERHQKFLEERNIGCRLNLELEKGDFVSAAGSEHGGLDEKPERFIKYGQKTPTTGFSISARFYQPLDSATHQNMILTDKAHMRKFSSSLVDGRDVHIKNLTAKKLGILASRRQFNLKGAEAIEYQKDLMKFKQTYGFSPLFNPAIIDLGRRSLGLLGYIPGKIILAAKNKIKPTRGRDQNDAEGIFHVNIDKTKNSKPSSK